MTGLYASPLRAAERQGIDGGLEFACGALDAFEEASVILQVAGDARIARAFRDGLPRKAKPQQPKEPKAPLETQPAQPAL